jgi:hypothetical protein
MTVLAEYRSDESKGDTEVELKAAAPISNGIVKVLGFGALESQGADRRLFVRVNGIAGSYQSFCLMNGHAGAGEWDNSGFYIGRNGWYLNADASFEFTMAISPFSQKITGSGLATFGLANNTILGYESHGFLATNQPIGSVQVQFGGGVWRGDLRFVLL